MIAMDKAVAMMDAALRSDCPCHSAILQLDFKDSSQHKTSPLDRFLVSGCDAFSLYNGLGGREIPVRKDCKCSEIIDS